MTEIETLAGGGLVKKDHLRAALHLVDVGLLEFGQRSLEVEILLRHRHRRGRPRRPRAAPRRAVRLVLLLLVRRRASRPSGASAAAGAAKPWRAASSAAPAAATSAPAGRAVASASPPALGPSCNTAAHTEEADATRTSCTPRHYVGSHGAHRAG